MTIDVPLLKTMDFFANAPNHLLDKIQRIAHIQTYEAGHVLTKQGQRQDTIYLVVDGKLSLHSQLKNGKKIALDEVQQGGFIGMSSLFEDAIAEFSIVCAQNCSLIVITAEDAFEMFTQDYAAGYEMMLLILERFRKESKNRTQQFLRSLRNYPEIYSTLACLISCPIDDGPDNTIISRKAAE